MKVIIVDHLFSLKNGGGSEIIAYNTYNLLKEAGIEAYYWSTNQQPYIDEKYKYTKYFTKFRGGSINYLKNPLYYYYNIQAKKDLSKFIEKIKPDIIHYHSIYGLSFSVTDLYPKIPKIMTIHESGMFCPTMNMLLKNETYCANLLCKNKNFINCVKNVCVKNNLEASIRRALVTYVNSLFYKNINHFVVPSNALKNLVVSSNIGIKSENISVINNGIEIEKNNEHKTGYYFLYVGRLDKEKGIHYLLEAFKDLPKEIEVHIVGTGKEEINCKQFAEDNNIDNVKFLGFKNREEIKEEYKNCIATILPCNWFENFPTTVLESFSFGKPVIASNIGGIPEQVEHNKTGLLFEVANVDNLKNHIMFYFSNQNIAYTHGENAYQKASTLYTSGHYIGQIINLYQKIKIKNSEGDY